MHETWQKCPILQLFFFSSFFKHCQLRCTGYQTTLHNVLVPLCCVENSPVFPHAGLLTNIYNCKYFLAYVQWLHSRIAHWPKFSNVTSEFGCFHSFVGCLTLKGPDFQKTLSIWRAYIPLYFPQTRHTNWGMCKFWKCRSLFILFYLWNHLLKRIKWNVQLCLKTDCEVVIVC